MGRLDGLVAVVTGGGRGIGRAIALEMAREGADIAVSSRTQAELDAVVAEAEAMGRRGMAFAADALARDEVTSVLERANGQLGKVDILVNNVGGFVPPGRFGSDDADGFIANVALNLVTHHWATQAALPGMRERGYGEIINIGSGYAKRSGGAPAYTAAKHGLIGYTRSVAAIEAQHGITVNCLCPGWTNTQLLDWERMAAATGTDIETAKLRIASENLVKRILEPEELGPMAVLLAAPESAGITGQVISVDGGFGV